MHTTINGKSPSHFDDYFELIVPSHNYHTIRNPQSAYSIPPGSVKTLLSFNNTLKNDCIHDWNTKLKLLTKQEFEEKWFVKINPKELKRILNKHHVDSY